MSCSAGQIFPLLWKQVLCLLTQCTKQVLVDLWPLFILIFKLLEKQERTKCVQEETVNTIFCSGLRPEWKGVSLLEEIDLSFWACCSHIYEVSLKYRGFPTSPPSWKELHIGITWKKGGSRHLIYLMHAQKAPGCLSSNRSWLQNFSAMWILINFYDYFSISIWQSLWY